VESECADAISGPTGRCRASTRSGGRPRNVPHGLGTAPARPIDVAAGAAGRSSTRGQSLNLDYMSAPYIGKISSMYLTAWEVRG